MNIGDFIRGRFRRQWKEFTFRKFNLPPTTMKSYDSAMVHGRVWRQTEFGTGDRNETEMRQK